MIRSLTLLIALFVGLCAQIAYGLGLGPLELKSSLNQQFRAEIELRNVGGFGADKVLVNLGSQDDFNRVGLDRTYSLTYLRFKVLQRDDGQWIVFITSTEPIVEPFLSFVIQVLWPSGAIIREYTVLLDPVNFFEDGIKPIQISEILQSAKKQPGRIPTVPPHGPLLSDAPSSKPLVHSMQTDNQEYGVTKRGDTLWIIALKVRPNRSTSVQQTMLAIKEANPDAFINDNINLLKAGYVLRIPPERDIHSQTFAAAAEQVRFDNADFDSYKAVDDVQFEETTSEEHFDKDNIDEEDDGVLTLMEPPETSDDQAGLKSRFDDLQEQIEILNEINEMKNEQIFKLEAQMRELLAPALENPAELPAASPVNSKHDQLLTNPITPISLGFVVLILLGGLIFVWSRQQAAGHRKEKLVTTKYTGYSSNAAEVVQPVINDELDDVLKEVEIFIDNEQFPDAVTCLQTAIDVEPTRTDIRLRLFEVYEIAFAWQLDYRRSLEDQHATDLALAVQEKIPHVPMDPEGLDIAKNTSDNIRLSTVVTDSEHRLGLNLFKADGSSSDLDLIQEKAEDPLTLDLDVAQEDIEDDDRTLDLDVVQEDTEAEDALTLDPDFLKEGAEDDGPTLDLDVAQEDIKDDDRTLDLNVAQEDTEDDDRTLDLDVAQEDAEVEALILDLDFLNGDTEDDGLTLDLDFVQKDVKETLGVDRSLIEDGTYFIIETKVDAATVTISCGGWGKRKTLYGGDHTVGRE